MINFEFDLQRFDSTFSGGSGTESDPYRISNLADLEQLRRDVNGGNGYGGKYLKVTNDITLTGTWIPIGDFVKRFNGTFDGDGHIISNLTAVHQDHNLCDGLFGFVRDATIKNVHLTNVNIKSDYYHIGALIAEADNTQVSNCSVKGNMEVGGIGVHAGGLFGQFFSGNIKNCAFLGTFKIVDQVLEAGVIAGLSPQLDDNYYYGDYDNLNPNGAVRIYNVTVPNGVSSSGIVTFVGTNYIKKGEVTFDYLGGTYKYNVTGDVTVTLKDNKLFANDIDLGFTFPFTLDGNGSKNNPFIIKTAEHLSQLAAYVNYGNDCAGMNFKLADDITLTSKWTAIGTSSKNFKGTFDGDGHTVSGLTINSNDSNQGLFGKVSGATIKNLNLTGVSVVGREKVGALVGEATGNTRVSNCSAQGSVAVTGMMNSSGGGLVGEIRNTVTVDGCSFRGDVKGTTANFASRVAGVVGNNYGGVIMNSAFLGGTLTGGNVGAITCNNSGTLTDNFYCGNLNGLDANGAKKIFRLNAPGNVTSSAIVTLNGTKYITAGNVTFTYNGRSYNYTVTDDLAVTVRGNNLSFDKIDLPENFLSTLDGNGSENNPFIIKTAEHLSQLAAYVNYGNDCAGMNFKLADDIALTNGWIPVGDNVSPFKGTFDGNGHTVSGLTVNDTTSDNQGLFGKVSGATIKNLNLTGVSVTGRDNVGAIVGNASSNTQIVSCSASGTVKGSKTVGGLVGVNSGTVKDSTYLGGTITGTSKGAIVGNNSGTLTDNFYLGKLAGGVSANGATRLYNITVPNDVTLAAQFVEVNGTRYIKGGDVTFTYNGKDYNYTVTDDITVTTQGNKILINNAEPEWRFPDNLDGNGSEGNPFLIKTAEHLSQLANYVNAGNNCSGKFFKLANDIKLTGEWTPVGNSSKKFKGTFDGDSKTVSGLTISNGDNQNYQGLFCNVDGATIKNVKLTGVNIIGHYRAGALVGNASSNSQILNCSASGTIKSNKFASFIGGVVGHIDHDVMVDGCSFTGNINGISFPKFPAFGSHCGGVVGFYGGGGTIKNSAFLGGSLTGSDLGTITTTTAKSGNFIDNYYLGKLADGVDANGATQIFNVTVPDNVTSTALVTFNGMKYIKAGDVTFTYGGNNYNYKVTGDIAVTTQGNKIFVGGEELNPTARLTMVANENPALKSSAALTTFSSSATVEQGKKLYADDNGSTLTGGSGDDSLWGGAGHDTFIHNGGNDIIFGFGEGDTLKVNGLDDITATYDAADNYIRIPCGAGSVTLKDFTTNEFAINNSTWTLIDNTMSKKK